MDFLANLFIRQEELCTQAFIQLILDMQKSPAFPYMGF